MEALIHTVEKAYVLITVTVVFTGIWFAEYLFLQYPVPRDHFIGLLLFFLFAAIEEVVAQLHSPMDARIIAACVTAKRRGNRRTARLRGAARQSGGNKCRPDLTVASHRPCTAR